MNNAIRAAVLAIADEWTQADRAIRETLKGWPQQAARAGLENGAYLRMGKAADSIAVELGLDEEAEWIEIGRVAYKAARLA